ncbi:MAG: hypothetical protein QOG53_2282 [Frankiales bacterium]|nr:hypothetical protein [Frankiales bacterium]
MIGTGGPDVIETSNADVRRRRWPWLAAGLAAVVALAVVLVAPRVQSHRTASDVRWLRDRWVEIGRYDDARQRVLTTIAAMAGRGDEALVRQGIAAIDHEVAAPLHGLADHVTRHSATGADVRRLRDEISHFASVAAAQLDDEARSPQSTINPAATSFSLLMFDTFNRVVEDLASTARKHGVSMTSHASIPPLRSTDGILARLARIVDGPVVGELLVVTPVDRRVLDLSTGRLLRTIPAVGNAPGEFDSNEVVGNAIWSLAANHRLVLTSLADGSRHQVANIEVVASTIGGHLWVVRTDGRMMQIDTAGRVLVSPRKPPRSPLQFIIGSDRWVAFGSGEGTDTWVYWDPRTGTTVQHRACQDVPIVTPRLFVYPNHCSYPKPADGIDLFDPDTGQSRAVKLPRDYTYEGGRTAASLDGRHLALRLSSQQVNSALAVLDVSTGRWQINEGVGEPMTWSADGKRLFITDVGGDVQATSNLGTWTLADPVVRGLRIKGSDPGAFLQIAPVFRSDFATNAVPAS